MIYQDRLETNLLQLLVNADILASNAARQWLLIAVSRDAGERRHCPSDLSKGGQRRRRCLYHNRIIGNFMAYQDRNETHFLQFLLLFLRRCWTVGNIIGDDFFLVFQKFPSPLIFLMLPLTYRCSGVPVAPPLEKFLPTPMTHTAYIMRCSLAELRKILGLTEIPPVAGGKDNLRYWQKFFSTSS